MWQTVPFPPLPHWLPIAAADRPAALRQFGIDIQDLAVDFAGLDRPWIVTRALSACAQTHDGRLVAEQTIWELPVSTRIAAIVALAGAVSPRPLEWRVRCGYAGCAREGSLELEPAEIAAFAESVFAEELVTARIGSRTACLRRPTGIHQRRWLESGVATPETMATALLVDPPVDELTNAGFTLEEIAAAVDRAMGEYDPLVDFNVEVGCHACNRSTAHTPDLTAAALERLWRAQFGLVDQVHLLASQYHWTEDEIARVPFWRRQAYLDCIGGAQ